MKLFKAANLSPRSSADQISFFFPSSPSLFPLTWCKTYFRLSLSTLEESGRDSCQVSLHPLLAARWRYLMFSFPSPFLVRVSGDTALYIRRPESHFFGKLISIVEYVVAAGFCYFAIPVSGGDKLERELLQKTSSWHCSLLPPFFSFSLVPSLPLPLRHRRSSDPVTGNGYGDDSPSPSSLAHNPHEEDNMPHATRRDSDLTFSFCRDIFTPGTQDILRQNGGRSMQRFFYCYFYNNKKETLK